MNRLGYIARAAITGAIALLVTTVLSACGYAAAFGMIAGAGAIALVIALAIPRRLQPDARETTLEPGSPVDALAAVGGS